MKLLFVHETKIKEDVNGNYYTGGSYNEDVWNRYLSIASDLNVVARKELFIYDQDYAQNKFNYFDNKKIGLMEVPDLNLSIKSFFNYEKRRRGNMVIRQAVLESDLIIVRLPSSYGNIAIKFAKQFNKPYLVEVVGCPWDAFWNHSIKGKIVAPFMFYFTKKAVKKSPYVLYVSNEFLQHRYPSKGKTLGCSDVSLPPLDESILERRLNKINQMSDERPIVLGTVAAVNIRYKGQEYVIKAISKLNEEGYNFEYYLVGGGDNDYLKSVAEKYNVTNKVKFLGSLPHDQVFEFMKDIDIYIQPSNAESHGRVIVEAMQTACPVIGSSTGGIPELVSPEFVFKRKNVNDLIAKIKRMTKEKMMLEAKKNFEKAKEFEKATLDKKRSKFYMEFKNSL